MIWLRSLAASGLALTLMAGSAAAEDDSPTRREVQDAKAAVENQERDVAAVQADLVLANQRLRESAMEAAQAAEAWNGARYRLQQAQQAAAAAKDRAATAQADVDRQREAYGDALASSYQTAPELTALTAIVNSDGIDTVLERTTTMGNAEAALDSKYDAFRAASTLAGVASRQAADARAEAMDLQVEARTARDAAQAAADAAAASASSITAEKDELIAELARLQDISVDLAEQRQSALEQKAAEAAAQAAAEAAEKAARREARRAAAAAAAAAEKAEQQAQRAQKRAEQRNQQQSGSGSDGGNANPQPAPQPNPQPQPAPAPAASPSGARAAIGFARAQIGEPYRWGAAGPSSWDCSGLTMGAWREGGKYLPHYSVAQYEQSSPISPGALQPGDLVFWGSSSSPSSIYHVALYAGGGQIIHAPRTGRPVTEESMYYWTPPNFYARP